MKAIVKEFYNIAMGNLMEQKALTHGRFFTQKEFEDNHAKIFAIAHVKRKADDRMKQLAIQ